MFVCGVSFILSVMIAQIRIENTKIKPLYMLFSAVIGILVVLIMYQIVIMKPDIIRVLNNIGILR